jgi:hypothetical protein
MVRPVDEGLPIAYQLLEDGVPVLASGGEHVGSVVSVLSEPAEDVFHGLLVKTPDQGLRFIDASSISSIHEHGVDLRIDSAAAKSLPLPEHGAPVFKENPGDQDKWHHWVHKLTGRNDWHRET